MRFMKAGATSQSIYLEVLDSTSTTGGRKTGLAYNTSSLTAYYVRNGGSATSITLATLAAANSAYSSGGFKEVDATNMPGIYRLDVPDAAVASGATSVVITLKGATGMVQTSVEIQLVTFDPQDSVRMGMTAFAGITSLAEWLGLLAGKQVGNTTARTELRATGAGSGTYDETTDSQEAIRDRGDTAWTTATGFSTHSANDVWSVGTRTLTAGTNIQLPANGLANVTAWTVDITGSLSGSVGSVAGAVGSVTGNVGGNVSGNVVGSVGSLATQAKADVNAEVDAALVDIGLDHLVSASVTGTDVTDNSIIAKMVSKSATADWDSYTNTTDALEAIRDRGDSSWTTATGFSTLDAAGVRLAVGLGAANLDAQLTAIDDYLDTEIAAIKAKTDQLTFTVANQVDANALSGGGGLDAAGVRDAVGLASANLDAQLAAIDDYIDTEVAAIKAKTDNLPADPADASDIAASFSTVNSTLATIAGYIDTEVAAIKAKTDNLPASPAATGDIPSAATVASAVRTELATELARIDAAISTRQISIWSSAGATVDLSGTTVKAVTDTVNADMIKLYGNASAARLLSLSARTMHDGTVTGSATTTSFVDSATSSFAETDQFKGRIIIFYDAEHIIKEATNITAYDPGTNAFTFAALSRAPTVGDAYVIV